MLEYCHSLENRVECFCDDDDDDDLKTLSEKVSYKAKLTTTQKPMDGHVFALDNSCDERRRVRCDGDSVSFRSFSSSFCVFSLFSARFLDEELVVVRILFCFLFSEELVELCVFTDVLR